MNAIERIVAELSGISVDIALSPNDGKLRLDPIELVPPDLLKRVVANKPELIERLEGRSRIHVHRVLTELRSVGLYLRGDKLEQQHPELATEEQIELTESYRMELTGALTPRGLTADETALLALWLGDIEADEEDRRDVLEQIKDPSVRTFYIWMADGSPA